MQAIFIASGPSFKEAFEIDTMLNLNVYSLVCNILHLNPAPNNGTVPFEILRNK